MTAIAAADVQYPPKDDSRRNSACGPGAETPIGSDSDSESQRTFAGEHDHKGQEQFPALPPTDTGYAWVFLVAAWAFECLSWGFAFSIGVLHEYWTSTLFPDPSHARILSVTATLVTGILFTAGIFVRPIFARYPHHRAKIQFFGLVVSVAAIVGTAYAPSPAILLVMAGLLYPVGAALLYYPVGMLIYEWFSAKRGLAAGIMYSGSGVGGALWPIPIQSLLSKYSYKASVISLAVFYAITCGIALIFVKERIPVRRHKDSMARPRQRVSLAFLRVPQFYPLFIAVLIWGLGNIVPSVYLPTFVAELGYSSGKGTLLVSLVNGASAFGLPIIGFLSDHWSLRKMTGFIGMGAALSAYILWGLGSNLAVLIIFALTYGFCAIGSIALWTPFIGLIAKDQPDVAGTLFTVFAFATGLGNIAAGFVADSLLSEKPLPHARFGYGTGSYGSLILWTGSVMAVGSIVGVAYRE